jgi:hypothetical protein
MKLIIACITIIACVLVYAPPRAGAAAMGGDVAKELQTATFHAGELAQRGDAVAASKLHLQHVINCLEGPSGADFKAAAGFPCEGQGQGIIPDLKTAVAAQVPGADKALREANLALFLAVQAIGKSDVNEVQPWAKAVANHLKASSAALGP